MSTSAVAPEFDGLSEDGLRVIPMEEFATTWAVQRSKFAWLLGAGTSASAGVPLARSIRDRLLFDRYAVVHKLVRQDIDEADPTQVARVHAYFDGKNGMPPLGSEGDYSAAFELCLPEASARKALLQQLLEDVQPGFAQRVFGGLVVSGACDLVVTTNFDRLIEQGFAEAQRAGTDLSTPLTRELNTAGLDSTARATYAIQNHQWPLVLKLHGDFREKRLMNTDGELQAQDAALRRFVVDASRRFGLVVSGYSGRDESVMAMLAEAASEPDGWPQGIWWIARSRAGLAPGVQNLLRTAAASGVSATVVVSPSFDETMTALARQVTVDDAMRDFFNRLHPKPRLISAAIPQSTRKWPVIRFNAIPIIEATVTATCVALPGSWSRAEVQRAMTPRREWPAVVSGPGEMLCLGEPEAALAVLRAGAAKTPGSVQPGPAELVNLDLLADDAQFHHQAFLLQLIAGAVCQVAPVWMRTGAGGSPDLLVDAIHDGETVSVQNMRRALGEAYKGSLYGSLESRYGQTEDRRNRRWAEKVELSFEHRAGQTWLLFRPWTWVSPLPRPSAKGGDSVQRSEVDPANSWRAELWAQRRYNETWAAIIAAWTALLAPEDRTELIVASSDGKDRLGHIVLGRTNAYSRPV